MVSLKSAQVSATESITEQSFEVYPSPAIHGTFRVHLKNVTTDEKLEILIY